jgi:hypothetical protein
LDWNFLDRPQRGQPERLLPEGEHVQRMVLLLIKIGQIEVLDRLVAIPLRGARSGQGTRVPKVLLHSGLPRRLHLLGSL